MLVDRLIAVEIEEPRPAARRDAYGRFAKGGPGGPGRRPRAVEAEYISATIDSVPLDRWRNVIKKALEDAEEGDFQARKFLADYILGRPVERVETSTVPPVLGELDDDEYEEIERRLNGEYRGEGKPDPSG